ncbi:hypothetical protein [Kitasatospora sp. NPDC094011]|uniref:hypothetical protein n=1 Tax=Kitasatospora sp. NPDC094011 TaxID=3364090 RepID=UPI00380D5692
MGLLNEGPDLSVQIEGPAEGKSGEGLAFKVSVTNNGTKTATSVRIEVSDHPRLTYANAQYNGQPIREGRFGPLFGAGSLVFTGDKGITTDIPAGQTSVLAFTAVAAPVADSVVEQAVDAIVGDVIASPEFMAQVRKDAEKEGERVAHTVSLHTSVNEYPSDPNIKNNFASYSLYVA